MFLSLDYETYSDVDIERGATIYASHPSTEIILASYAEITDPMDKVGVDSVFTLGESGVFLAEDKKLLIHKIRSSEGVVAHNATFERLITLGCLGLSLDYNFWICSMALAGYHGLPRKLKELSKPEILNIPAENAKKNGNALINYFCKPDKKGERKTYLDSPEKWGSFCTYNKYDVVAQQEVMSSLILLLPPSERKIYVFDQYLNDKGVKTDLKFVERVNEIDKTISSRLKGKALADFGVENMRSNSQVLDFIQTSFSDSSIKSVDKKSVELLLKREDCTPRISEFLSLKKEINRTSIAKYKSYLKSTHDLSGKMYNMLNYYGAVKTGRFSGASLQLQNLMSPGCFSEDMEYIRSLIFNSDVDGLLSFTDRPREALGRMVRTAIVPDEGCKFAVADYSAIEARKAAWLTDLDWKLEVFRTHGKIYEATASQLFGCSIEEVSKEQRFFGKTCELALAYRGWLPSFKAFGADTLEKMNKSDSELIDIIKAWRHKNYKIVEGWDILENAARTSIVTPSTFIKAIKGTSFYNYENRWLIFYLPSGRTIMYYQPKIEQTNRGYSITYAGYQENANGSRGVWGRIATHGGKLFENLCQGSSRDILCENGIIKLLERGVDLRFHVHDETVSCVPHEYAEQHLLNICNIMEEPITWCPDLPLKAEGFICDYYKK